MTNVYARAKLVASAAADEDEDVEGVYAITVSEDCPLDSIEQAALEAFHGKVAIGEIDDFAISVADEDGRPFPDQVGEEEARSRGPLGTWGRFEGKIADDARPGPSR